MNSKAGNSRRVIAIAMILPALILLLVQQVIPTVRTLILSLQQVDARDGSTTFVGFDNYTAHLDPEWFSTLLPAIAAGLVPAVAGFLIGHTVGRVLLRVPARAHRMGLAVLGIALISIAPLSYYIATFPAADQPVGIITSTTAVWIGAAAVAGALVGQASTAAGKHTLGLGIAIAAGAGAALGLQMTTPAMASPAEVPMSGVYYGAFGDLAIGPAAAMSTILLVPVMILGIVLTLLLLGSRLHLRADPYGAPAGRRLPGVVGLVAAVLVLAAALVLAQPWLMGWFGPSVLDGGSDIVGRTWLAAGRGVVPTIALSALAGIGIGYFRPFGARSSAVLLLFSPWLLVSVAPLVTTHVLDRLELGLVDLPVGRIYPHLLIIPLLFLFTYLAGAVRRSARPALLPALAIAGLASVVLVLLRTQEVLWTRLVATGADSQSAPVVALRYLAEGFPGTGLVSLLSPAPIVLVLAVVCAMAASGARGLHLVRADGGAPPDRATDGGAPRA
ncbi:MAG TPA: hypothetical protein VK095_06620 [Beutenbergiaceae bacterium]|nr:hypothetical protein [Beutenbergiaceae bacterium]